MSTPADLARFNWSDKGAAAVKVPTTSGRDPRIDDWEARNDVFTGGSVSICRRSDYAMIAACLIASMPVVTGTK